jgi:hypothetical protein
MAPKKALDMTRVVWLCEFIKNHQFWFLKILQKDQRTAGTRYVQDLKEPAVFMKELVKDKQFYRWLVQKIQFWRNMFI